MEPGVDLLDREANSLALELCELSAHISAASAELAAKAARFDESGGWGEGGTRSCAEFLSQHAGLDLRSGHDLLRVGRALNQLPQLAAACAAGELSFDKARAVASVATPEDEAIFVELARQLTGSQVARFCHAYRRAMLAAEPDHDLGHQERRSLQQTWREDGMVRLVALLPPDDAATVIAAINAITGGRPVTRTIRRRIAGPPIVPKHSSLSVSRPSRRLPTTSPPLQPRAAWSSTSTSAC